MHNWQYIHPTVTERQLEIARITRDFQREARGDRPPFLTRLWHAGR